MHVKEACEMCVKCETHMKMVWKLTGFHMVFHTAFHMFASGSGTDRTQKLDTFYP